MTLSIMTLSIMTLSILTPNIMTLSITTLSIMTLEMPMLSRLTLGMPMLSKMTVGTMILSIMTLHKTQYQYRTFAIMLNVVAPKNEPKFFSDFFHLPEGNSIKQFFFSDPVIS
jgi:hypothetical protein